MVWLLLAFATAVLYAAQGGWTKHLTDGVSPGVATWAIFAFAFPFLLLYLVVRGVPPVGPRFWGVLAVNSALGVLSFYLYVTAIQRGELGITYPLLALTPIFVIPVEWLLLGDAASARGMAGIALVVAGVYLLNLPERGASVAEPFRALARDPGARRMLAVALLWSLSGTLDRMAVLVSSPAFYGAWISGVLGVLFVPLALRGSRSGADTGEAGGAGGPERPAAEGPRDSAATIEASAGGLRLLAALRERPGALALQGALFAGMFVCQMEALRLALAAYVLSIKRSGALLSVFMGARFFGEERLGRRLAGTAVILAGVVLVAGG